jgi:adenylosuccinate lyase
MIDRYEVPEIARIWSPENRYRKWLDVEIAITEVWHAWGQVPDPSMENIRRNAAFNVQRIDEIELKCKHDVIAFLSSVEEFIGADSAFLHKGITSYDIVDTALSLLLRESLDLVIPEVHRLAETVLRSAFRYKDLMTIGRTHGIHAEPITFGCKFLIWYEELLRTLDRLEHAKTTISVGKISGSVGTYIHFPPEGEELALQKLDLVPDKVSSQIIQRDRHAEVMYALVSLGSVLEKMAVEIRHLQRTEVLEAEEPFSTGQKGSSSMPHKRNPVKCERISGFARLLRGYLSTALENNILWHERDISHSSAERIIFPDAFHAALFSLRDMQSVIAGLNVYPEHMQRNLAITQGVYFSQKVLTFLLDRGIPRQAVYEAVQSCALRSWQEKLPFRDLILGDETIRSWAPQAELEKLFDPQDLLSGIHKIFNRFQREYDTLPD